MKNRILQKSAGGGGGEATVPQPLPVSTGLKFDGHRHSGSRDIKFLVCHVILT